MATVNMAAVAEGISATELGEVIIRALDTADEPLRAKQLRDRLSGPWRIELESLQTVLDELVAAGRLHRYQPYAGRGDRYWVGGPDEYIRLGLLRAAQGRSKTQSELFRGTKTYLAGMSQAAQKRQFDRLLAEGQLHKWPAFVGARAARYAATPPDAGDYLRDVLEKLRKKLEPCQIPQDKLMAELAQIVADSHGPASPASPTAATTPTPPASPTPAAPPTHDAERLILERALQVEPRAASTGALVSFFQLRPRVPELSREAFDQAILSLRDKGAVQLQWSDDLFGMDQRDREASVSDSAGKCNISMKLVRRDES